jgi:hypothetical protein
MSAMPEKDRKGRPVDPYKESAKLPLYWIDESKPLLFTGSSKVACNALKNLANTCVKQLQPGEVPVIEIDVDSYQHPERAFGRVYFGIFHVIDSMPAAEAMQLMGGDKTVERRPQRELVENEDADPPDEVELDQDSDDEPDLRRAASSPRRHRTSSGQRRPVTKQSRKSAAKSKRR